MTETAKHYAVTPVWVRQADGSLKLFISLGVPRTGEFLRLDTDLFHVESVTWVNDPCQDGEPVLQPQLTVRQIQESQLLDHSSQKPPDELLAN